MKKKIVTLVGALAISSVAMAGTVDPSANPADGTNVWTTGQTGSIAVKGRMISEKKVDEVKYVIYAGEDKSDVLNLPDFILSTDENKCGFVKEPDNIYVKRVVNGEVVDLSPQDGYKYRLTVADGYYQEDWSDGDSVDSQKSRVMKVVEKDTSLKLKEAFGEDLNVTRYGTIESGGRCFYLPSVIALDSDKSGVIKFKTSSDIYKNTFTPDEVKKVMKVFEEGVMTDSNVQVQVKMN